MKNSVFKMSGLAMLVAMLSVLAAFGQSARTSERSANSLLNSATPANRSVIAACNAAVDELTSIRVLVGELEKENAQLAERLATEKQLGEISRELNDTHRGEAEALRATIAAKDEALAAKGAALASQEKLIETLRAKRRSPLARIGDVLVGVGAAVLLRR